MNLYLIRRVGKTDYDEYEGAVVVAPSADVALRMHPEDGSLLNEPTTHKYNGWSQRRNEDGCVESFKWPREDWPKPDGITCTLLGPASPEHTDPTVILASFLAG